MADKEDIKRDYKSKEYSVSFFYDMYDRWLGLPTKEVKKTAVNKKRLVARRLAYQTQ